ncbi:MAG: EF2563 family selenium-dependent molybdenum hydroxylase system protein [Proteobacteria bacterium]|nr:EF2563 family selenium-dependent molybdenum hydroxylase system protein [Pseudomonadota bacterium]
MEQNSIRKLNIGIKGAGEMASAIAWRLYMANIRKIFMMEIPCPLAVRRGVCFCEAIHEKSKTVEGVEAIKADSVDDVQQIWDREKIAVLVDPGWISREKLQPDVILDAIVAKKNLGTTRTEAFLVIGLGPGFVAGSDVDMVIETNRGHNLGRIITSGSAEADTGIPGDIGGYTEERVMRAPASGVFRAGKVIGDSVKKGEVVGAVAGTEIRTRIDGVIRGLIRSDIKVTQGLKLGDIDPRGDKNYCYTISDKARAIAGSVLEAVLRIFNI